MCKFRQDVNMSGWRTKHENSSVYTCSVCWACRSFQYFQRWSKRDWWLYCCMCTKKETGKHMDKIKPEHGADCPWAMAVCFGISRVPSTIEINDTLNDKKLQICTIPFCNPVASTVNVWQTDYSLWLLFAVQMKSCICPWGYMCMWHLTRSRERYWHTKKNWVKFCLRSCAVCKQNGKNMLCILILLKMVMLRKTSGFSLGSLVSSDFLKS